MTNSECRSWRSIADLVSASHADASVALVGAPLAERSLTPGRCDLGPATLRRVLPRFSVYDLESRTDLADLRVFDRGDLALKVMAPAEAFAPIRDAVAAERRRRELVIIAGGNNAITRPGLHGAGRIGTVGLLTLDAHFDLRDTDCGLNNGNPIQALLEDGLDGGLISQIGLAPFANTRRAHEKALAAGVSVRTASECAERGAAVVVAEELERLGRSCERVYVDFDIDVIERSQFPAAPGARPGGMTARDFFACTRAIGACRKVSAVDLAEFDPSLDVGEIGALTAGRWFAELLAGFAARAAP